MSIRTNTCAWVTFFLFLLFHWAAGLWHGATCIQGRSFPLSCCLVPVTGSVGARNGLKDTLGGVLYSCSAFSAQSSAQSRLTMVEH